MFKYKKLIPYASLLFLIILIIWPVFILGQSLPFDRIFTPGPVLFSTLGKLAGLVGLAAFSFSLFLASRFVWLDKLFYGLPRVLNIHRWLGVISFVLIIFHPLFLAARLLPLSGQAAFSIFLYWTDTAYLFGYLAFLMFMFLVLMTFFWRMRYERLKSLHSLMAIPLMIGGIHGLLIDSDIKNIPELAMYYIVLISISVLAYLMRLLLISYGLKARSFVVRSVEQANDLVVKVVLAPFKKPLTNTKAGQFIFVSFPQIKKGEEHPFSITDIQADGTITIMAKQLGDYTKRMQSLSKGFKAMVDGPYGSFGNSVDKNVHQVWIAGGIGITPFLSMAKSFKNNPDSQTKVDLFYIVSSTADLAGVKDLQTIEAVYPNFKLTTYISDQAGRFDIEKLYSFVSDFSNCNFYICGPTGLMEYLVGALKKERVAKSRINIEAFKLL